MPKLYHDAYIRLRSKPTGAWLVHPELRNRLVADADADATTLTDVVTAILADRFGLPYTPRRLRSRPVAADGQVLKLRIPVEVWRAIGFAAAASDRDENDVIREALCTYYGLSMPSKLSVAA